MSKKAKLLAKLRSGSQDRSFSYAEAVALLINAEFRHDGGKGSHNVFRHADGRKMTLPRHGKEVKPCYIRQIRELLAVELAAEKREQPEESNENEAQSETQK